MSGGTKRRLIAARVVVFIGLGILLVALGAAVVSMVATLIEQGQWIALAMGGGLVTILVGGCIAGLVNGWDKPWI